MTTFNIVFGCLVILALAVFLVYALSSLLENVFEKLQPVTAWAAFSCLCIVLLVMLWIAIGKLFKMV